MEMFYFVYLRLFKLKTEGQTIYRSYKTKIKLLAYLNRALNNPAQELRF